MSIYVVIVRNQENPYIQVSKSVVEDPNMSMKALGLWIRCFHSSTQSSRFDITLLGKYVKEGRKAIYSGMNELIELGYVLRYQPKKRHFTASPKPESGKTKNQFQSVFYFFFENAITEQQKTDYLEELEKNFTISGFNFTACPKPESGKAENQGGSRAYKDSSLKTSLNNSICKEEKKEGSMSAYAYDAHARTEEEESGAQPPNPPHTQLKPFGTYVKLIEKDYETLCMQHGKKIVDDVIDTLNNKIEDGSYRRSKNYCATLRNWIKLKRQWDDERKAKDTKFSKYHGFQKDTSDLPAHKIVRADDGWVPPYDEVK